jgi:hypothetical protein
MHTQFQLQSLNGEGRFRNIYAEMAGLCWNVF